MRERIETISSCAELIERINDLGFLPLLRMGGTGWSAEEQTIRECGYQTLPEGGWEWPLWEWKGPAIRESGCAYGKFFAGKAGFISREWWPDFCNWRRSRFPRPADNSIEAMILETLQENGSLITRKLRAACGLAKPANMRGRFDTFISRLENGCYIVTEDFVYPHDKHGRPYGWGWALLTTPERIFGTEACCPKCTPEESYQRMAAHFLKMFPYADENFLNHILK